MRAEIAKTTRENKEFVRNVERAKVLNGIQSKAAAKRKKAVEDDVEEDAGKVMAHAPEGGPVQEKRRTFKQIPLAKKWKQEEAPDQVQRVLSKIF